MSKIDQTINDKFTIHHTETEKVDGDYGEGAWYWYAVHEDGEYFGIIGVHIDDIGRASRGDDPSMWQECSDRVDPEDLVDIWGVAKEDALDRAFA